MVDTLRGQCEKLSNALNTLYKKKHRRLSDAVHTLQEVVAAVGHVVSITERQEYLDECLFDWLSSEIIKLRLFIINRMLVTKSPQKAKEYFTIVVRLWRTSCLLRSTEHCDAGSTESFEYFQTMIETDCFSVILDLNTSGYSIQNKSTVVGSFFACFKDLKLAALKTLIKACDNDNSQNQSAAVLMQFWCQLVSAEPINDDDVVIVSSKKLVTKELIANAIEESMWAIVEYGEQQGLSSLVLILSMLDEKLLGHLSSPLMLAPKFMKVIQADNNGAISLEQTVKTLRGWFALICNHRLCLDPEEENVDHDKANTAPPKVTLVNILFELLCPELFSIEDQIEVLKCLTLAAKILTKWQAMEFAKRSLQVACLVPPIAAKWLIHYARRLLIRHKEYAIPLLHLNYAIQNEVELNPIISGDNKCSGQLQVIRKNMEQPRLPDYVLKRLSLSLFELELLQQSVDVGVRQAAKSLVDRFIAAPC